MTRDRATRSEAASAEGQPGELRIAAAIARRYYLDNVSKVELATEFGLSRFKIARLLERARAEGIVRIEITEPQYVDQALSDALRAALGLRTALVADDTDLDPRTQVGALAAAHLHSVVTAGSVVGIAWSRATQALVEHLHDLPACTIVQLCGVIPQATGEVHNVELVRRAASTVGSTAITFYAPLVVPDPATARTLRRQPGIADALTLCDQLSVAAVAIGQWAPGESTVHDALPPSEREMFAQRGAVAETAGILFDADGRALRNGLQNRVIAVTEKQLRHADEVIGVAFGANRAPALHALTRSGLITTLITNRALAERALTNRPQS